MLDALPAPHWQPVQRLAAASLPIPVWHAFESPFKVTQLTMLEQSLASRLMRTAHKVARPIHFDRNPLPIVQSNERIDSVAGDLATVLILYLEPIGAKSSHHVALELRNCLSVRDKSGAAGLA